MRTVRTAVGPLGTNCYILFDERERKGVIIDPGGDPERILSELAKLGVTPASVLLTHGHFDHILGVPGLQKAAGLPLASGEKERALLSDPAMNLSALYGSALSLSPDLSLRHGELLLFPGFALKALETPGHTAGSVSFYAAEDGLLFSGDTVFRGSYGRTDFPTGDAEALSASIRGLLTGLPGSTVILPGHGEASSVSAEKERYGL